MEIKHISMYVPTVKTVADFDEVVKSGKYGYTKDHILIYDVHNPESDYGFIPKGTKADIVYDFQRLPSGTVQNMYLVRSTGQIVNG